MMTDRQQALVSLLLGTFPNFQSGDAEAALAAYDLVLSKADQRDIEPGIMMLINGELPGFDGRFAPTSAQLARAIRISLDRRVDLEIAERKRLPPPVDDWVEPSPEQRARGKAILDKLASDLAAEMRTVDAEAERARRQLMLKTNERFDAENVRRAAEVETYNSADDEAYDMGARAAS